MSEQEVCLVALAATQGVGPATVNRLLRAARRDGASLREVLAWPVDELRRKAKLASEQARAVAGLRPPIALGRAVMDRLQRAGLGLLLRDRPGFPTRLTEALGAEAPHVLFARGDTALAGRRAVAVVGSREPSPRARAAAQRMAGGLAAGGTVVVSGGARGIDTVAHRAALDEGATVVLPATGLFRFRSRRSGAGGRPAGRWCVLSAFPPGSGWRSAQALMRNSHIVALAQAVLAFDPRDCGGTWNSCTHALRLGRPLFVVTGDRRGARGRGLRRLVRMGAQALDPDLMPSAAEFSRMVAVYQPPPSARQVDIFRRG
ncbi:MAG: DNA-processing protein DprA [Candidatus Brocadiia bacterium]